LNTKVFSGDRMIDTKNGKVINNKISIIVENENIIAVDSSEKITSHPAYKNAEKIELSGTLLPGLVDSHVHLIGFGDGTTGDVLVKTDDNLLAKSITSSELLICIVLIAPIKSYCLIC